MNTNFLYKTGYLLFAILLSTLIFYKMNNGFRKEDCIRIPILTIIIFLVIYYSTCYLYSNKKNEYFASSVSSTDTDVSSLTHDILENFKNTSIFDNDEEEEEIIIEEEIIEYVYDTELMDDSELMDDADLMDEPEDLPSPRPKRRASPIVSRDSSRSVSPEQKRRYPEQSSKTKKSATYQNTLPRKSMKDFIGKTQSKSSTPSVSTRSSRTSSPRRPSKSRKQKILNKRGGNRSPRSTSYGSSIDSRISSPRRTPPKSASRRSSIDSRISSPRRTPPRVMSPRSTRRPFYGRNENINIRLSPSPSISLSPSISPSPSMSPSQAMTLSPAISIRPITSSRRTEMIRSESPSGPDKFTRNKMTGNKYEKYPRAPTKKFRDRKPRTAMKANKFGNKLSDTKDLINKNEDSTSPININVSYNNSNPNDVNKSNLDKDHLLSQFADFLKSSGGLNLNRYTMSSGLEKRRKSRSRSGSRSRSPRRVNLNPVNNITRNAALSSLNQSYYPGYLQNPLNKDQPGTHIKSIFDRNRKLKRKLNKQLKEDTQEDRKDLIRKDDNNWMQSNYEVTMLKNILSQPNDPAPVILESPWSQWAPAN